MGRLIGIDLGTTNSVVAICDGPQPRILESREIKPQTRSVVGVKKRKGKGKDGEAEILVGEAALDNWPLAPKDTIVSVKRLMGRAVSDPEVEKVQTWALYSVVEPSDGTKDSVRVVMGAKEYSPIDISAIILKKLKEDAEFRLNDEVSHAVITVPAYFSQVQRDATRKAGIQAGLKVIKILDEPTAAAISFGMDAGDGTPKMMLVYDLGGGTFDISVLMWAGNVFAPINLQGDMWLGGDNFDQVLVDHVVKYVKQEYDIDPTSNMRFMVELKKAAQKTKESLGPNRKVDLVVAGALQDSSGDLIDIEIEITREVYERMIRGLVDRTVSLTKKALADSKTTPDQIDFVLMAGNSTGIPLVQQAMEELFGASKVMRKVHPKHCVALGAAILAARIGPNVVCSAPVRGAGGRECGHVNKDGATVCAGCGASLAGRVGAGAAAAADEGPSLQIGGIAPFHYGTQSAGDKFNLYIEKGEPYPTESPKTQTFTTRIPNARMISIPVYGGEDLDHASRNEKQGEAFAVLPPGLPQGAAILIRLSLDSDGIFEVDAHLDDGTDLHPWVVTGGNDAKAIEVIQGVEQALGEAGQHLSPQDMGSLEGARNEAFDAMKKGDFDGAIDKAKRMNRIIDEAEPEAPDMLANVIGYMEFILHEYAWAIDPNQAYRLNNLVEEAKRALESGTAKQKEEKAQAIVAQTERLPQIIQVFVGVKMAIRARIHPNDPAIAMNLEEELEEVENAFKSRNRMAESKLTAFLAKLQKEIAKIQPAGMRCHNGHPVPAGQRNCPVCKEDTWLVDAKGAATSTTGGFRRK